MDGAPAQERLLKQKVAGKTLTYRYRWFNQVPLRDGHAARLVDWVGVTITDTTGKATYDSVFVISLCVTRDNVSEIAACARARWKSQRVGMMGADPRIASRPAASKRRTKRSDI